MSDTFWARLSSYCQRSQWSSVYTHFDTETKRYTALVVSTMRHIYLYCEGAVVLHANAIHSYLYGYGYGYVRTWTYILKRFENAKWMNGTEWTEYKYVQDDGDNFFSFSTRYCIYVMFTMWLSPRWQCIGTSDSSRFHCFLLSMVYVYNGNHFHQYISRWSIL